MQPGAINSEIHNCRNRLYDGLALIKTAVAAAYDSDTPIDRDILGRVLIVADGIIDKVSDDLDQLCVDISHGQQEGESG